MNTRNLEHANSGILANPNAHASVTVANVDSPNKPTPHSYYGLRLN